MNREVFICHSSKDQEVAKLICGHLEAKQISCWLAPRDEIAGSTYASQIVDAIDKCVLVILLFSQDSNQSPHVVAEIELARNRQKPILPIRMADVALSQDLEYYIRSVQWFDACTVSVDERLDELIKVVNRIMTDREDDPQLSERRASAILSGNLVVAPQRLIGRDRELAQAESLLVDAGLLTIHGVGGIGKTRFGVALAGRMKEKFPDGVWFIDLSGVVVGADVVPTIAQVLHVRERAEESLQGSIIASLLGKRVLIVLDNCEQVLAEAASFADKCLEAAPTIRLIATSREWLSIGRERRFPLEPLDVPADSVTTAEQLSSPAVELFYERAREIDAPLPEDAETSATVARICRHLDGIPLAIELAAARTALFDVRELQERMDDLLRLLSQNRRDTSTRHKTVETLIDWSYRLLQDCERVVFWRLSSFAGRWTLQAAAKVCADDDIDAYGVEAAIESLIEKSLVARVGEAIPRRYRLYEMIKAFAERMSSKYTDAANEAQKHRYVEYFRDLATDNESRLGTNEQAKALQTVKDSVEDLRSALRLALADGKMPQDAGVMAIAYARCARLWGVLAEGRDALVAASTTPSLPPKLAADIDYYLGEVELFHYGNLEASRGTYERILQGGISSIRGRALYGLAAVERISGNYKPALQLVEDAIECDRANGDKFSLLQALTELASINLGLNKRSAARKAFHEANNIAQEIGNSHAAVVCAGNGAVLAFQEGDLAASSRLLNEAVNGARSLGMRIDEAYFLCIRGEVHLACGRCEESREDTIAALEISASADHLEIAARSAETLAALAYLSGNEDQSLSLFAWGALTRRETHVVLDRDDRRVWKWKRKIAAIPTDAALESAQKITSLEHLLVLIASMQWKDAAIMASVPLELKDTTPPHASRKRVAPVA